MDAKPLTSLITWSLGPPGVWVLGSKAWHRRTAITGKGGALQIGSRSAAMALKGVDFERGAVAAVVHRAMRGRVSGFSPHGNRQQATKLVGHPLHNTIKMGMTVLRAKETSRCPDPAPTV